VLSAGEGSYLYILGAGIRAYRASSRHPLRLETADGTAAVDAVSSARAHLGVASLEAPPGGLTVQPLTRVGQVLAMPTRHPLAARRAIRLQHLEGADLIVPPMGRPHRTILSQMLQSARVQWRVAVEASGWELMLKFVQMGLGLAVVNACCRLPKGVVARPLPELPSLQYFIFHSSRSLPKPAMELKESLVRLGDSWREQRR
jgi:DNA-binding transcriptional LysR family regulator